MTYRITGSNVGSIGSFGSVGFVGQSTSFGSNGTVSMHVTPGGAQRTSISIAGRKPRIISINGKEHKGRRFEFRKGILYIDEKRIDTDDDEKDARSYKIVSVKVKGDVQNIVTQDSNIQIDGNVENARSTDGDILIRGDCTGRAHTVSGAIDIQGKYTSTTPPMTVSGSVRILNQSPDTKGKATKRKRSSEKRGESPRKRSRKSSSSSKPDAASSQKSNPK